jgi:hypothetical protein
MPFNQTNNQETEAPKILYKYKSLSSFQYILDILINNRLYLDILINNRLYAARYVELNDPMEGFYKAVGLNSNQIEDIYNHKNILKITSFSANPRSILMWSHYADSHRGIAIGVKLSEAVQPEKIDYLRTLPRINSFQRHTPKQILKSKLQFWKYEEEWRVFTEESDKNKNVYVNVEIKELIFGMKTDEQAKELLQTIVNKFNPKIKCKTVERDELLADAYVLKFPNQVN